MTYRFFNVNLGQIQSANDALRRPIETYKSFITRAGANRIATSNFNKYSDGTTLRLEVRANVINEEMLAADLQQLANTLITSGNIQSCNVVLRDWNEPDFVKNAHETATKCAVLFKEKLDEEQQTLASLLGNVDPFMWQFMIALLRQAGFNPRIVWGLLRTPISNEITSLTTFCSPTLLESITDSEPTADFLERFIHCFFNCTLSNENMLLNSLMVSNIWQDLINSLDS